MSGPSRHSKVIPASLGPGQKPIGPNHAFLIGELAGLAQHLGTVRVLDDSDGDHTDTFIVVRPSGYWRVTVRPERVIEP